MSHQAIAPIWTKLEKRTDLGATLCEAIGQYAIDVSLAGEDRFAPKSLRAFDRLINLIKVTFHLQRTYLQPRKPSFNLRQFLLEPSQVTNFLLFLLTVKDKCFELPQSSYPATSHVLRSIGGVLLSGLRFLTLLKAKVYNSKNFDWESLAKSLRPRLQHWPIEEDSLDRFLIRDLCGACLDELSLSADLYSTGLQYRASVYAACSFHAAHAGPEGLLDLPDYNDGLYPLNPRLTEVIAEATCCMQDRCQWWFQSFCTWYDAWSALIAASMQLYSRVINRDGSRSGKSVIRGKQSESCASFVNFYVDVTYRAMNSSEAGRSRLGIIRKTMLTLSPFPNCSVDGCDCFEAILQHEHQAVYKMGQDDGDELIDPYHQIADDLERRQHTLQDPNGRVQQLNRTLEDRIVSWTATDRPDVDPSERFLEPKHVATYIVNCPEMHPLTRSTIEDLLDDSDDGVGIEGIQSSAELVKVGGIKCPHCRNRESARFTQARLVKPVVDLNEKLKAFLVPPPKMERLRPSIVTQPNTAKRHSTATEPSPASSGRSLSIGHRNLQPTANHHSRTGSGDNTSYSSSKGRRSIWRSASSSPNIHISYTMFADARFVLAYTSNRISCYDCDLRSWSQGYSFNGISMAAGSVCRYAVISKEITGYQLSVLRRDQEEEYEEWPPIVLPKQPYSLAISRRGEKIAVGFVDTVHVYNSTTGTSEQLPAPKPPKDRLPLTVDSQCISFSVDTSHLVVATRETRDGQVFTGVYDLRLTSRSAKQMNTIRIPSHLPRDFHLSSVVYDQFSSTVCHLKDPNSNDQQRSPPLPRRPDSMRRRGARTPPRIALVNDSNNVFVLEYLSHESRWMPQAIPVKLGKGRKGVNKFDDKMSIAATSDGTVRMFWMEGEEGRLLSIDSGSGSGLGGAGPFVPETIPATPF